MITYNENDVAGFKAALAHYAVKEHLILGWIENELVKIENDLNELSTYTPSLIRDGRIRCKQGEKYYLQCVKERLETPADMFLTDFEMRGCK